MRTELSDLDGMIENVRDLGSRDLIAEAVVAYRAGALRSSIILCWAAVFGDLVAKIRELSQGGNKAAAEFVTEFDRNINNPQKMLALEREIIEAARAKFLMFDHRDQRIFERLREDRNACAHPTLAGADGHFSPIPELVRSHLAHALDRLLIRPPAQGKEALIRLWRDLDEDRLPVAWGAAVSLIQTRYIDHATETLRRAVARGAVGGLLLHEDPFHLKEHPGYAATPTYKRKRGFLACLEAVGRVDPNMQGNALTEYSRHLAGSSDLRPQLMALLVVSWKPTVWSRFPPALRSQILHSLGQTGGRRLSDATIKEFIEPAFGCIAVAELAALMLPFAESVEAPLYRLSAENIVIFERPSHQLINVLIDRFAKSWAWRASERNFDTCIWPIKEHLEGADIERILIATIENGDIWDASGMRERLAKFFVWLHSHHRAEGEVWARLWVGLKEKLLFNISTYRDLHDHLLAAEFITLDPTDIEEEDQFS